jgi:hypothetical protein
MRAQRAVNFRKSLGDCQNLGMLFNPSGYGHERCNASRACARHDVIELAGKIRKVEMTMAIDQHKLRSLTFVIIRYRHRKPLFFN